MWCSKRAESDSLDRDSRASGEGKWTGSNLIVMILGFVFFWPVGLFIVFWIASGRSVHQLPAAARALWDKVFAGGDAMSAGKSDNSVFNDYQQTQFDRISEIKEEIKSRARRFNEFRSDAKRRADEEEFNRFMNDAPRNSDTAA